MLTCYLYLAVLGSFAIRAQAGGCLFQPRPCCHCSLFSNKGDWGVWRRQTNERHGRLHPSSSWQPVQIFLLALRLTVWHEPGMPGHRGLELMTHETVLFIIFHLSGDRGAAGIGTIGREVVRGLGLSLFLSRLIDCLMRAVVRVMKRSV